MKSIFEVLASVAREEARLRQAPFLAPCVRSGKVRVRVAGLARTFAPRPSDFEGWGLFTPDAENTATCVEEASLPLVLRYLERLPRLRLRLARKLRGYTWLAYPVNESDARQRLGMARPLPVHLVAEGQAFERVLSRYDGQVWWFEEVDRRADPRAAETMRAALQAAALPETLRFPGLTPEMRATYDLAVQQSHTSGSLRQERHAGNRLRAALTNAGGELEGYEDRGEFWQVEWITRDGARHRSAIGKQDLTVLSSGICLSGEDRKFDLQSLVGVIEKRGAGDWDDWEEDHA